MWSLLLCCWKRVFAMTSAFPWQSLLAFDLLVLYSKAKCACYLRYFLTSYFCIPVPYNEKDIFFGVLILEGLVGFHRTVQLQFLKNYWSGHRLGLLWYWMVCLGNKQIVLSFLRLNPRTAFWTLLLTMMATPFLLRDLAHIRETMETVRDFGLQNHFRWWLQPWN